MKKILTLTCAAALCCGVAGLAWAASGAPAFIYDYSGPPAGYSVVRGGHALHVAPFMPLRQGDVVEVGRSGRAITVEIGERLVTLTPRSPRYCLCDRSHGFVGVSARVAALFRRASFVFASAHAANEHHFTDASQAQTALAIPLISGKPLPRTPVYGQSLAFAWIGGSAPFSVQLTNASNAVVASANAVNDRAVTLHPLQIAAGNYTLHVSDARHASATATFAIVDASQIPNEMADDEEVPAPVRAALASALLARQGREWYLAAYQGVTPPKGLPAAEQLRAWLAQGGDAASSVSLRDL